MATSYKNYAGTVHAHGCTTCKTRYEDTCRTPAVNGQCAVCQGLQPWQLLIDNRKPRDCCRAHSRLCNRDERNTWRLSEGCSWFRCLICSRTFPYIQPRQETS